MSVRLNVVVEVDAMLWRCWDCDYWHASGDAVECQLFHKPLEYSGDMRSDCRRCDECLAAEVAWEAPKL